MRAEYEYEMFGTCEIRLFDDKRSYFVIMDKFGGHGGILNLVDYIVEMKEKDAFVLLEIFFESVDNVESPAQRMFINPNAIKYIKECYITKKTLTELNVGEEEQ